MAILGLDWLNRYYGTLIAGSNDDDTIYGRGGNDVIYAGRGVDHIDGGSGDDSIFAHNRPSTDPYDYWGRDVAQGGDGNDTISYGYTLDPVEIYGDHRSISEAYLQDGNDRIWGGRGNDFIVGGGGNDIIYGGNGNDTIMTDYGSQTGPGYIGTNTVIGGRGQDVISVSGDDTIVVNAVDSFAMESAEDIITGFDRPYTHVHIDMPGQVTASNYAEVSISPVGFKSALAEANAWLKEKDYVFVTDHHDGYVFADTDLDGFADTSVKLQGITSKDQFDYHYIV